MCYTYRYDSRKHQYVHVPIFKRGNVMLEFDTWDITWREFWFSILILGVLIAIGFFFSDMIKKSVDEDLKVARQAIHITDPEEFQEACKTDVGHAFTYGELVATKPIVDSHVNGLFTTIYKKFQTYRSHIVTYTTTDNEGRTHTHHSVVWEWVTDSVERYAADEVTYLGKKFSGKKFDYSGIRENYSTVSLGHHKRVVVYTCPQKFMASAFTDLRNDTVSDNTELRSMTLEELVKYETTSCKNMVFWIFWIPLMIVIVIVFYVFDNKWLED